MEATAVNYEWMTCAVHGKLSLAQVINGFKVCCRCAVEKMMADYPPEEVGMHSLPPPTVDPMMECPKCHEKTLRGYRWCVRCGYQIIPYSEDQHGGLNADSDD